LGQVIKFWETGLGEGEGGREHMSALIRAVISAEVVSRSH